MFSVGILEITSVRLAFSVCGRLAGDVSVNLGMRIAAGIRQASEEIEGARSEGGSEGGINCMHGIILRVLRSSDRRAVFILEHLFDNVKVSIHAVKIIVDSVIAFLFRQNDL
jgi:hypothetical protein